MYKGPLTWTTDPEIGRPGYYALEEDGRTLMDPHVLLTWVDQAPGDAEDGSGYFYVADPDRPYFTHHPPHVDENFVELSAEAEGTGGVDIGDDA